MIIWYEGTGGFGGVHLYTSPAFFSQMTTAPVGMPSEDPDFHTFESETTVYAFMSNTSRFSFESETPEITL